MYIFKKNVKNIFCFFLDIFIFFFIDPHGNKMVDRLGLDITHENPAVSGISSKVCGKRPRLSDSTRECAEIKAKVMKSSLKILYCNYFVTY